jgi:ABC-type phosphate transport system substrate-binding protein
VTFTGTVDFANSDAGLSDAQVTAYNGSTVGQTSGPLIQLPFIVTPIAIPIMNGPNATGPALPHMGPNTVALNDDDLCGIFSGKLTNINQLVNPLTSTTYAKNAVFTVVYRSDNSGTTDLLTRHLKAVCTTANTASGFTFAETQNFAGLFTAGFPSGTHFVGESGSGSVAAEVKSLASAGTAVLAYLSPDYTNTFLAPSSSTAAANNLSVASLKNANSGTVEIPSFGSADNAVASVSASIPSTSSAAAIPTNWVPNSGNPSVGYPLSGTSQIIISQCYKAGSASPTPGAAIQDFITTHYGDVTLVNGNGFDVPSAYLSAITANFFSDTSGHHLNIGNTAVCGVGLVTGR